MKQDDNGSAPMLGSHVVAYAVIDDEGVQHSLWFLETDAIGEAAMVGGTVVRLCQPSLTDEEREAISAAACICEDAGQTDIAVIVNTALSRLG